MKYNFCETELSWLVHLVKYSQNSGIKNFLILVLELVSENSQKNICGPNCGLRKLHMLCPSNVLYYNYCSNLIYIDTTYAINICNWMGSSEILDKYHKCCIENKKSFTK